MCSAACRRTGSPCPSRTAGVCPTLPALAAYQPRRDIGFHFVDQVAREAKAAAGIEAITANSYTVRSTINTQLQRVVEAALQEGLSRYERNAGRVQFRSAEAKPCESRATDRSRQEDPQAPAWQQALANAAAALRRALDAGGSWRSRAARRARAGASASPTDASCRSRSTTAPRSASSRCTTWFSFA